MLQILQKTSHKIGKPFHVALKRDEVNRDDMAEDLKTTKQTISHHATDFNCPPDMAVKYSEYLHDPKFNQQMAAIYFDAISMFDPDKWAKKFRDAPFATWVQLRNVEKRRMEIGEKVFEFGVKDRSEWTKQETELAYEWMNGLLKTISLATLMASQFADMAHYDLDSLVEKFNRLWGGIERK